MAVVTGEGSPRQYKVEQDVRQIWGAFLSSWGQLGGERCWVLAKSWSEALLLCLTHISSNSILLYDALFFFTANYIIVDVSIFFFSVRLCL